MFGTSSRVWALYRSPLTVLLLWIVLLPLWATTRLNAWTSVVRTRSHMLGSELMLGPAAVPVRWFPWHYDETALQAFVAKNDPFAAWDAGDPAAAQYVHIPPWEPGLAIPLKIVRRLFHAPISLTTLAAIQLALDVLVLAVIGMLAFEIGGPIAAALGIWVYAGWTDAAAPAAFPFYYYWPSPFGVLLAGVLAIARRYNGSRWWWAGPVAAGLVAGTWCWFRGTGGAIVLVAPVLAALVLPFRKALWAAGLALLGSAIALAPSAYHNWPRTHSIMPRAQIWHDLYVGLGTRPNPYGIVHKDGAAKIIAERKYGKGFQGPGYESALRTEYLSIVRRNPGLILRNFVLNFADSIRGWSLVPDPSRRHDWFWLVAVAGIAALALTRDPRSRLLAAVFMMWIVQCATLSVAGRPQAAYLWETVGISVLCGAAGFGAAVEAPFRALARLAGREERVS